MGQGGRKIKNLKSSYWVALKWPEGGGLPRGKVSLWASAPFPPPPLAHICAPPPPRKIVVIRHIDYTHTKH